MKKLLPLLILPALILPFVALGQIIEPPGEMPDVSIDLANTINNVLNWLFAIAIIAAVAFLILAAINFITQGGDPKNHEKAKNMIIYALVGVAVAVLAKGLVALVENFIKGTVIGPGGP